MWEVEVKVSSILILGDADAGAYRSNEILSATDRTSSQRWEATVVNDVFTSYELMLTIYN